MRAKLSPNSNIIGSLRTRQKQDVEKVAKAILERVRHDELFAPLLDRYVYATLHHYQPKFKPITWQVTPEALLSDLVGEQRSGVILQGPHLDAEVDFFLNCEQEIVRAKVEGKRRQVPKASDSSRAGVSAKAAYFTEPEFIQAYLSLLGDMFEIMDGGYGKAEHLVIRHGNDFDRVYSSFFEPSFITWANLFGPALVAQLGRARLLSAPGHEVREMPGGSILLTVAASPMEQLDPPVQERIARVKAHLGILSPSERASAEELAAFEARSVAAEAEMKQRIEEAFRQAREETAAEMLRQAEGSVEGVRRFWGEHLDFSPQSLAVVDRLLRTGFGPRPDAETVATATQAFGAYVGEVVRRGYNGIWHDQEMQGRPILVKVGPHSARVDPFRAVAAHFDPKQKDAEDLVTWYKRIGEQAKVD